VQDQVGALERVGVGRPVASIQQKAQQGQRPPSRVCLAGGDVAPERGPGVDRTGGTQRGKVAEIVEQEGAVEAWMVDKDRYQQAQAGEQPGRQT